MSHDNSGEEAVPLAGLHRFARQVLEAVGMPADDANRAATAMCWADARGLASHGVAGKLPSCVARIEAGGTAAAAPFVVLADAGALVMVDGGRAWGQVAAARGMELAIERASSTGICAVSIRDVGSAGAMGAYVAIAVDAGMIGLAFTNGSPIIPAWGGSRRVLGNQGHAIGCPTPHGPPVIYDAALTVMSTGALDRLHERGESVPEGVVFDANGRPTTNPGDWFDGMLAPAGGHRGYGLAMMIEMLTGVLSGGERFAPDVGHPAEADSPQGVSLLLVAIDPELAGGRAQFITRVGALLTRVLEPPPADGVERVWYPGERSGVRAEAAARSGVTLEKQQRERIGDLAERLRVAPPWSVDA